jgi:hypothetical protein
MKGLNWIKKLFLKKATLKKRPTRKPLLKSVEGYENVLVIASEKNDDIEELVRKAFIHAKIVHLERREKKVEKIQSDNYTIHSGDISLTGKIKNDKLRELFKHQFDLIIDLSDDDPIFTGMIEKIEASFLIGRSNSKRSFLYDLSVEGDWNNKELIPMITQQIKLLSQHGKK